MERQPQTRDIPVEQLISGILAGTIALVDFQRDFDWSDRAVRSLLATILMGWPAGSLLAAAGTHPDLTARAFHGGPPPRRDLDLIILDGQQRLTALLQALSAKGENALYVPLSAFSGDRLDEIEEKIVADPADLYRQALPSLGDPLIPLSALIARDAFVAWRQTLQGWARDNDLGYELANAYRNHLHWLHDYRFPVITLDASVDPSSVARIFERVNRTGLRLGSFDLVVARTHSAAWHLRDRWDDARLQFPMLDAFYKDDGLPILQAIGLVSDRDVRQAAIIDLETGLVLERWDAALQHMDRALRFLVDECGVRRAEWLPYRAVPLVLGALGLDLWVGGEESTLLWDQVSLLRQWVLFQAFSLRYDAAVNTRVVTDFQELRLAVRGEGAWPDVPPLARERILLSTTRQAAPYRSILCALALHGAQDLRGLPMRLNTLPAPEPDLAAAAELAVAVPLLPRDNANHHLRSLNVVLAHPQTASEIHQATKHGGLGEPSAVELFRNMRALDSQFVSPTLIEASDAEILISERLSLLALWLETKIGGRVF